MKNKILIVTYNAVANSLTGGFQAHNQKVLESPSFKALPTPCGGLLFLYEGGEFFIRDVISYEIKNAD